ncbi:hypothetical protein OIU77_018687 [Salix suchowensis]|uniref:Uncharacterized protein n=1 Tax=Salix suchowensis TaxID=1278906 RepID=A0ABQ9CED3_9ROSI|nr:hypothetical protein OIU77_018687 [Salix suchowensis]
MGFVRSITFDAYRQVLKLVRFPRDHKDFQALERFILDKSWENRKNT